MKIISFILIGLLAISASAYICLDSPGWPPSLIETHGYYYYGINQGFYKTPGGQDLQITAFQVVTINDPVYGTIYKGRLMSGLGIEKGWIYWNSGGVRDYGLVIYNDGSQNELEVMGAPFGGPAPYGESRRGAVFVSPWQ